MIGDHVGGILHSNFISAVDLWTDWGSQKRFVVLSQLREVQTSYDSSLKKNTYTGAQAPH